MEGVVGGRGAVVAVVIVVSAPGALDEPDAGVDCWNNISALERRKGPGL